MQRFSGPLRRVFAYNTGYELQSNHRGLFPREFPIHFFYKENLLRAAKIRVVSKRYWYTLSGVVKTQRTLRSEHVKWSLTTGKISKLSPQKVGDRLFPREFPIHFFYKENLLRAAKIRVVSKRYWYTLSGVVKTQRTLRSEHVKWSLTTGKISKLSPQKVGDRHKKLILKSL